MDDNAPVIPFKTAHVTDFRAPSNVNACLREGKVFAYPLLRVVLSRRYAKRVANPLNLVEYYAGKMGIPKNALDANGGKLYNEILEEMMKRGIFIRRDLAQGKLVPQKI